MPVSPAMFKPPPRSPSALLKAPRAARCLSRRAFRQQQSQHEAGRERGTLQAKLRSSSRQWPLNHTWVHVRIQPHNWVFQRRSDEAKAAYFKEIMQRAAICPPTSPGEAEHVGRYPEGQRHQHHPANHSMADDSHKDTPRSWFLPPLIIFFIRKCLHVFENTVLNTFQNQFHAEPPQQRARSRLQVHCCTIFQLEKCKNLDFLPVSG